MSTVASYIDNLIVLVGFSLMIGTMAFPVVLKSLIVLLVNLLVSPLAAQVPFYVTLIGISFVMTSWISLVQRLKVDQGLLKRVTEKNAAIFKSLREAQASKDKKALRRLMDLGLTPGTRVAVSRIAPNHPATSCS